MFIKAIERRSLFTSINFFYIFLTKDEAILFSGLRIYFYRNLHQQNLHFALISLFFLRKNQIFIVKKESIHIWKKENESKSVFSLSNTSTRIIRKSIKLTHNLHQQNQYLRILLLNLLEPEMFGVYHHEDWVIKKRTS